MDADNIERKSSNMTIMDLSGVWRCEIPGQQGDIRLPGTLDEAGFGGADNPRIQWKVEEVRRTFVHRRNDRFPGCEK